MNAREAVVNTWTVAGEMERGRAYADDLRVSCARVLHEIQREDRTPTPIELSIVRGWLKVAEGRP